MDSDGGAGLGDGDRGAGRGDALALLAGCFQGFAAGSSARCIAGSVYAADVGDDGADQPEAESKHRQQNGEDEGNLGSNRAMVGSSPSTRGSIWGSTWGSIWGLMWGLHGEVLPIGGGRPRR